MPRLLLTALVYPLGGCSCETPSTIRRDGGALDTGIDAPMTLVRDSGVDSGPFDGGGIDAGRPDTGPPPECTSATDCTDGNSCNGIERCELGRCVPGVALTCDDGVACTVDTCAASACTYTPTDSRCGAGQRCTATGCMTTGGGCAETPCRPPAPCRPPVRRPPKRSTAPGRTTGHGGHAAR